MIFNIVVNGLLKRFLSIYPFNFFSPTNNRRKIQISAEIQQYLLCLYFSKMRIIFVAGTAQPDNFDAFPVLWQKYKITVLLAFCKIGTYMCEKFSFYLLTILFNSVITFTRYEQEKSHFLVFRFT